MFPPDKNHYYNEHDPKAAAWLRELIAHGHLPDGFVDERSITDVRPDELSPYTQCHFFVGVAGWSLALRLAGWPPDRAVWTGSCPCQPFSVAGQGKGTADERHLWPAFFDLIRVCRPPVIIGEQVASKAARAWLDGVCADLEGAGYACGASNLCSAGAGAPHIRQRLYWLAFSQGEQQHGGGHSWGGRAEPADGGAGDGRLGDSESIDQRRPRLGGPLDRRDGEAGGSGSGGDTGSGGLEHSDERGRENAREQCQYGSDPNGERETVKPGSRSAHSGGRLGESHGTGRLAGVAAAPPPGHRRSPQPAGDDGGDCGLADTEGERERPGQPRGDIGGGIVMAGTEQRGDRGHHGATGRMADTQHDGGRSDQQGRETQGRASDGRAGADGRGGMAHAGHCERCAAFGIELCECDCRPRQSGPWSDYDLIPCRDGKSRRVKSGSFPLVAGLPRGVVPGGDPSAPEAEATAEARVMRLKGYGNALTVPVAAAFIETVMEILEEKSWNEHRSTISAPS